MALAHALAPKSIGLALRQHGAGVHPVQGEEARVPAGGDERQGAARFGGGVHRGKVLGDAGVGVEAVHHVEQTGQRGGLLGQVGGAAAAQDHHVDLVFHLAGLVGGKHGHTGGHRLDRGRVAPGENSGQLHIRVLSNGVFHAPTQISVTHNSDSDHIQSLQFQKV